jgi:hypothetical protein
MTWRSRFAIWRELAVFVEVLYYNMSTILSTEHSLYATIRKSKETFSIREAHLFYEFIS